jgi:hypothetical protein
LSGMFLKERLTETRWPREWHMGCLRLTKTSLTCKPIRFIQYLVNQPIIIWEEWTGTLLKARHQCRSLKAVIYSLVQQILKEIANRSCAAFVHTLRRHHRWANNQKLLQATSNNTKPHPSDNKVKQAQQNLIASQKQATTPSHCKQDRVKQLPH